MDHHLDFPAAIHRQGILKLSSCVLTIGAFDGVHRGHQELIGTAIREARLLGVPSVVYTFDPPPKTLLAGAQPLTEIGEKIARIGAFEPDHIVIASFDAAYKVRTANDFLREISALSPHMIWVGDDFRFGSCKGGNNEMLARYFDTRVLPAVRCEEGAIVSSTRIRALKAAGRSAEAARLEGWFGFRFDRGVEGHVLAGSEERHV